MRLKKYISEKISFAPDFQIEIDVDDGKEVRGWAKSNSKQGSALLKLTSSTNEETIIANQYRPDVRKIGLHETGYCGFQLDVSQWKNTSVNIEVLSVSDSIPVAEMKPVFFVHIPKTAGTSFRKAAIDYLGDDSVVKDYGIKSVESSACVRNFCYENKDLVGLYEHMKHTGKAFYSGHVNVSPGRSVFSAKSVVTFVRNPVEQVLSHFNHYSRWYDFKGSITDFVTHKGFQNLQSRHLGGIPLQLIGLIGITEKYSESLDLYNHLTQHNLKVRSDNINDAKPLVKVDIETEALILKENPKDIQLYDFSCKLLEQRLLIQQAGFDWVFGFVDSKGDNEVTGVAYSGAIQGAIEVEIYRDDLLVATVSANELRPGLAHYGVPRKSFIGFRYKFSGESKGGVVSVRVARSRQVLTRLVTSL